MGKLAILFLAIKRSQVEDEEILVSRKQQIPEDLQIHKAVNSQDSLDCLLHHLVNFNG